MSISLGVLGLILAVLGLAFILGSSAMRGFGVIGKAVHAMGQIFLIIAVIAFSLAAVAWLV